MPAYKDNKTGKWYCIFYYTDSKGKRKQKKKRGFNLKREALEWENKFLLSMQKVTNMGFNDFVDEYLKNRKPKIKLRTYTTKVKRFKRAREFFKDTPINKIKSLDIDKYLNTLLADNLSTTTIDNYKRELATLFNYAIKFHGLKKNPTHGLGKVYNPNERAKIYDIWTLNNYLKAIDLIEDIELKTLVNLLYWSGIRIGEALALSIKDFNFSKKTVTIDKSHTKINGKEIISPSKTYNVREILLPDTTINQIKSFLEVKYNKYDRLFNRTNENYLKRIKKLAKNNNLPVITIHDLRHSHASYLLSEKINIVLISKRLGHKDVTTTLNTYSHFMPTDEEDFIKNINTML